jgi:GntR family transcriptional regulator
MINSSSYLPLYVQLRDLLKTKIDTKEWTDGTRLPGENELCQEYKVSRTVVRQALLELELAGLVIRHKGRGTFVAGPKVVEGLAQKLTGFYEDMFERGKNLKTQVLVNKIVPADDFLAAKLNINSGELIFQIRRLRFVEGEPLVVVTSYLPVALCPQLKDVDLTDRSLYLFLEEQCHVLISRSYRTIEALLANKENADLLRISEGDPVILLEATSYLEDGIPVEYYRAFHRGDRARFEINLIRIHDKWRTLD